MPRSTSAPAELLRAIAAEDWQEALRLAARYRHLGEHKAAITRAWTALQHPEFYQALAHDLDAVMAAGIAGLRARFTEPHSKTPPLAPPAL